MTRFLILFFISFLAVSTTTYADVCIENPTLPECTGGGGICDWTEFKDSLMGTESAGDYEIINYDTCATGRYQFIPSTAAGLESYKNADPNCKQMCTRGAGLAQNACGPVQEAMMDEFTMKNLKTLKETCPAAQAAVDSGKTFTGSNKCSGKTLSCRASWSGILAAAHLGGAGGACSMVSHNANPDDGCTQLQYYACKHKDLPVPGEDCAPQEYPLTEVPLVIEPWEDDFTPAADSGIYNFNALADTLKRIWVTSFQMMTSHLTTTMMQQVEIIGTFFDAKHQLETQRLMQQKFAQAHKDYHPSEQMCEIGTFVRDLANSEKRADLTQTAMSRAMLDRALVTGDVKTVEIGSDDETRLQAYIDKFCSIEDNAKQNELLCKKSGKPEQQNADINFTQTIDAPLTLKVNLLDNNTTEEEESLFAFLDYIFMHEAFPWISESKTVLHNFVEPYQDMRSLIAMRNIAHNSFAHIIAEKTQGPEKGGETAAPFMKALMREMGMRDKDIEKTIGENPSYYAQMEILTKKIYQHPEFVSNLYDKPANVKRIRAAMTAIKVMQDRQIHKALMRREMLISMILELQLRYQQQPLMDKVNDILSKKPAEPNKPSGKKGAPEKGAKKSF